MAGRPSARKRKPSAQPLARKRKPAGQPVARKRKREAQPFARKRKPEGQPLARKPAGPPLARKPAGPPIAGQPLAPRLALEALEEFIARFGATPPATSPIWKEAQPWLAEAEKEFADLVGRCKRLSKPTLKKAKSFLNNFETNRPINKYIAWATTCRHRLQLQPSVFASALTGMAGAGAGAPKQNAVVQPAVIDATAPQLQQAVDVSGPVAVIKFNTAIGVIGLTPFVVGNWLYQATVDVYTAFQNILGNSRFTEKGIIQGTGTGEVVLWWGSHLGAARDQGLIAWDYDIDLAVFCKPSVAADVLWRSVRCVLQPLGYSLTQYGNKFRVCPAKPLCWIPWKELYHQVREASPGATRPDIVRQTAKLWKAGKTAKHPHGCNCVDIEFYHVRPGASTIKVLGTKKFDVKVPDLFPTAIGVFGPLQLRTPRNTAVLKAEYGPTCLSARMCKVLSGGGRASWVQVPANVRRVVWPCVCLARCQSLL